jgi:hypothetical protein
MEDNEVLVKLEHLSKNFVRPQNQFMVWGVDLYANILGNKEERSLRPDEFWAVKDINFELEAWRMPRFNRSQRCRKVYHLLSIKRTH